MYKKIFWCTNLCVRISARKSCSVQKLLCVTSSVCRNVSVQNASPQPKLKKNKQKNPRSNAWCRYRCWWWRWWAQGPTRRHFGCLKSIVESLRNNLLSSSDPHQVTLFLTYFLTCYLAFAFYLIYFLEFFLAFYLVYLRGFFVNEVRWATLWSWISICFFVVAAAAVTRGAFFSVRTDRTGQKSSNRRFIEALGAQNTVNTDVCCTSEAQTHGIYEVFASGNKNRGNYSVFWPVPSKNTGIYAFLACCKKYRFHAKGTKTL